MVSLRSKSPVTPSSPRNAAESSTRLLCTPERSGGSSRTGMLAQGGRPRKFLIAGSGDRLQIARNGNIRPGRRRILKPFCDQLAFLASLHNGERLLGTVMWIVKPLDGNVGGIRHRRDGLLFLGREDLAALHYFCIVGVDDRRVANNESRTGL